MSFFVRDSQGGWHSEYTDLKAVRDAVKTGLFAPGEYTVYKAVSEFSIKEVPARISARFESTNKRGPRKGQSDGQMEATAIDASQPRKRRGGIFGTG